MNQDDLNKLSTSGHKRDRAVIAAVQFPGVTDHALEASIAELSRLCSTLGYEIVGRVVQKRATLAPAAVLGEGKLHELAAFTDGDGVVPEGVTLAQKPTDKARLKRKALAREDEPEVDEAEDSEEAEARRAGWVIVDHDISPSQARNLEHACGVPVMDRTGVIVEIFHRHAKSREARLQVEIARLTYMVPRLRVQARASERQAGQGAGESQLELDRRKVRDRIAQLRAELAEVIIEQNTRRARRADARRVALVGYTNAGKSSLMRALTGSEVYIADKLFATLDTTVRTLQPESTPRILVSDTVGFISKLPHDLVASFRSTLDEAREASLLLFIVDASDPDFRAQLEVTRTVISEIDAGQIEHLLVLNKRDNVFSDAGEFGIAALRREYPDAVFMSAHDKTDVAALHARLVEYFDRGLEALEVRFPWSAGALVGEIRQNARVVQESCDEDGYVMSLLAEPVVATRLRTQLAALGGQAT